MLVYTQHRLHANSAASQSTPTSSNSHKDSLAARVKRCVHGFEEMAFATSAFVSWLVESADILEVTDNMALFAPLGRETDHHMDLLKLLALGHMQVRQQMYTWHASTSICSVTCVSRLASRLRHQRNCRVSSIVRSTERAGDAAEALQTRHMLSTQSNNSRVSTSCVMQLKLLTMAYLFILVRSSCRHPDVVTCVCAGC